MKSCLFLFFVSALQVLVLKAQHQTPLATDSAATISNVTGKWLIKSVKMPYIEKDTIVTMLDMNVLPNATIEFRNNGRYAVSVNKPASHKPTRSVLSIRNANYAFVHSSEAADSLRVKNQHRHTFAHIHRVIEAYGQENHQQLLRLDDLALTILSVVRLSMPYFIIREQQANRLRLEGFAGYEIYQAIGTNNFIKILPPDKRLQIELEKM